MLPLMVLCGVFLGFLALFWLSPIGVPTLKRMAGGQAPPDLRFGYGAEETYALLDRYGSAGIAHWRRMLLFDMVFPAVYAATAALAGLAWVRWTGAAPVWRTAAVALPVLAGASDYVENLLLFRVLAALPRQVPATVKAASAFTRAKFIFSHATLALPLLHWVLGLVARLA